MRDVELKACQQAEIKTELESLQSAFERFAMNHAMAPRPELKNRIMKAIEEEEKKNRAASSTQRKEPVVRSLSSPKTGMATFLAAASLVLLAVVSGLAYYFSNQYSRAKLELAQLSQQQQLVKSQVDVMREAMNRSADQLHLVTDENTVRVTMKGTDKSPGSMALIYWNKQTQAVYLDIKSLPPTPSDKQYQLWFIDPVRGPVNGGLFDVKPGEMVKMINAPAAAAFAVTLEPRGGSTNPTLDQMYVVGNVSS